METVIPNDFINTGLRITSMNNEMQNFSEEKINGKVENKIPYKSKVVESSKILVLQGECPEDVARAMIVEGGQTDPFYLLNLDQVYHCIQHFKKMMPRVQIFYAMKANDWKPILQMVVSQGGGFDCASPGEIYKIKEINVEPQSIIFAIPTKTREQMEFARQSGVKHTTFDSSTELKRIKQYWPDANLLIRIRVDGDSIYKLGEKFGCDFETEAVPLLEEAASYGLSVVGVAFHVGSLCTSDNSHEVGLRRARALFDHEARAGRCMRIVDIGGGFLSDRVDRLDEVAKLVNSVLEELFPDPSVQIIAEPGRYICDSSTTLYNSIMSIRPSTNKDKPVDMFYINDGSHGTLHYTETFHKVEKFDFKKKKQNVINGIDQEKREVILWGPTCDSTDRVMREREVYLPPCGTTDWLVFPIQGAYSWGFAGPFSSIPIPYTRAVVSFDLWNKIKGSPVFNETDFVLNPDVSAPLPPKLPPLSGRFC